MVTKQEAINAIFGQESSYGAADTRKPNYAGAQGPMQVTAETFEGLKRNGVIPKDFILSNPEHGKIAGDRHVGVLYDKYNGDLRKVAAAYYSGEKAVRKDGTIRDFRDPKNPKAPSTLEYAAQVARLAGMPPPAGAAPKGAPEPRDAPLPSVLDWSVSMPGALEPTIDVRKAAPAALPAPTPVPTGDVASTLATPTGEEVTQAEVAKPSHFESASEAVFWGTVGGSVARRLYMSDMADRFTPQIGFQLDPTMKAGMTEEEQEMMDEAVNSEHAQVLRDMVMSNREAKDKINANGEGFGLAVSLAAGVGEGVILGGGVTKALALTRVGSAAFAAQGARGAAVTSAAAENIGGNLAFTALQDKLDPYVSASDYPMALAAASLGTVLQGTGAFRQASRAGADAEYTRLTTNAAEELLATQKQAVANLGPEAPAEALHGEMRRLEAERVKAQVAPHVSELPGDRRLMSDEDNAMFSPEAVAEDLAPAAESRALPGAASVGGTRRPHPTEKLTHWMDSASTTVRRYMADTDPGWKGMIADLSEGMNIRQMDKLPGGLHVQPEMAADPMMRPSVLAAQAYMQFLPPGVRVVLGKPAKISNTWNSPDPARVGADTPSIRGAVVSAGDIHSVGVRAVNDPTGQLTTTTHEFGHVIFHALLPQIPKGLLARMGDEFAEFSRELADKNPAAWFKRFHPGDQWADGIDDGVPKLRGAMEDTPYSASADEYTAERFVDYIMKKSRTGDTPLKLDRGVRVMFISAFNRVRQLYNYAMGKGWLPKTTAFEEFFERALNGTLHEADMVPQPPVTTLHPDDLPLNAAAFSMAGSSNGVASNVNLSTDPDALKYNLDRLPRYTQQEAAEAKAVLSLYKKANDGYIPDEERLSKLMDTALFQGAQSATNTMARSDNPVVRMVAGELMESPSGALGRRSNASIAKDMNERAYLGNTLKSYEAGYRDFLKSQGINRAGDFFGGTGKQHFDRLVAMELESRGTGKVRIAPSPEEVIRAANALEAAYERMRVAQATSKTLGWAGLPETSKGYMPHRMSADKVRNMTKPQLDVLEKSLVDQFITIEGFDMSFAQRLAMNYIDDVQQRALGGFSSPAGIHQVGAADMVEKALEAMGMDRLEVTAMMQKYMRGAAGHTKRRLQLDLNYEHPLGDGGTFRLLDAFETDHLNLVRGQAQRVAGEVALARHGIMGKPGLKLLRRAMGASRGVGRDATKRELEAFDQWSAEMLGDPFGTQSKLVDRAMQATSLARLGGMGFQQLGEAINGVFHVGASRTLDSLIGIRRLRREIKALARGETVDNPIIGSLEQYGGAEFGTHAYKTVFPMDNPSTDHLTYGAETLAVGDKLLRGGAFIQGRLSFWRTLHATQQRGFAEQIVRKAVQYIKDGKNDVALRDMGISDELAGILRGELGNIAGFRADGKLTDLDITKVENKEAAYEFVQAVHRGVSQIIQGTFAGERSAWAHDGMMRLMTQFRTFSLTSIEKQWARQTGNVGVYKTLAYMIGSMSMAAPVYMSRTYLASLGREDQEEYLERQLTVQKIVRASLNYIALSGLAGDFLDAAGAVSGLGSTGGRTGQQNAVGDVVAPAAGLANDIYNAVSNTKEGTDPHALIRLLPFANLPYVLPAINALKQED